MVEKISAGVADVLLLTNSSIVRSSLAHHLFQPIQCVPSSNTLESADSSFCSAFQSRLQQQFHQPPLYCIGEGRYPPAQPILYQYTLYIEGGIEGMR